MNRALIVSILLTTGAEAQAAEGRLGVHGGLGTDIELGLAVGIGVSYTFPAGGVTLEIGPDLYYHHSTETSEEFGNTYEEETWITVFAVRANVLFDYDPDVAGRYFVAGGGIAAVNLEWEERSEDDPTANDSFEGTGAGSIVNVGVGYVFGGGFDLRVELPIIVAFSGPDDGPAVAPALTAVAGMRF